MPVPDILRRAAQLVAAGWSPSLKPLDGGGNEVLIFGGTVGDTARAGVNRAITHHTLYSAVVAAMNESGENAAFTPAWLAIASEIEAAGYVRGGTNHLHPALGFNVAEGRTAEEVQALLNRVANKLDPSLPKAATLLPPVTM